MSVFAVRRTKSVGSVVLSRMSNLAVADSATAADTLANPKAVNRLKEYFESHAN